MFALGRTLLVACVLFPAAAFAEPAAKKVEPAKPQQTKITISKETTRVLGPLDDEGYVDYFAALNEMTSPAVTPENNAAVLFWQAFGPEEIVPYQREEFFQKLGIEPLPEEGKYYLRMSDAQHAITGTKPEGEDLLTQQSGRATTRPWSKEEFPLIYKWLEINEEPLKLVVEGTKRPQYYSPLVRTNQDRESVGSSLIALLFPGVIESRDVARALVARAMLRLHEGKTDEAWQDLLACHRLARQIGRGPTIVEGLVGIAIDAVASHADAALAHHSKLPHDQLQRMLGELNALPPLPDMLDKIDHAERFMLLDTVQLLARGGIYNLQQLSGETTGDDVVSLPRRLLFGTLDSLIDWSEVLRRSNARYDRLVTTAKAPTFAKRLALAKDFGKAIDELAPSFRDAKSALQVLLQPRGVATEKMDITISALLMPAISAVLPAEVRAHATERGAKIALALGAYRTEHGRYPEELDDLIPDHLAELPKDPFTEASFRYEGEKDSALLYSVGPDGADNFGADSSSEPPDDDVPIRLPPKVE